MSIGASIGKAAWSPKGQNASEHFHNPFVYWDSLPSYEKDKSRRAGVSRKLVSEFKVLRTRSKRRNCDNRLRPRPPQAKLLSSNAGESH